MRLEHALRDLKIAFDTVAHEIEAEYPRLWDEARKRFQNENDCVKVLTARNAPGWGDKSLIEVAVEHGEDAVIEHFAALDAGGFA